MNLQNFYELLKIQDLKIEIVFSHHSWGSQAQFLWATGVDFNAESSYAYCRVLLIIFQNIIMLSRYDQCRNAECPGTISIIKQELRKHIKN